MAAQPNQGNMMGQPQGAQSFYMVQQPGQQQPAPQQQPNQNWQQNYQPSSNMIPQVQTQYGMPQSPYGMPQTPTMFGGNVPGMQNPTMFGGNFPQQPFQPQGAIPNPVQQLQAPGPMPQVGAVPMYQFGGQPPQIPQQMAPQQYPAGYPDPNFLAGFQNQLPQSTVDPVALLGEQNKAWEARFEKMLGALTTAQQTPGTDYFNMAPDKFVEEFEARGPQIMKEILDQATAKAQNSATEPLREELNNTKAMMQAMIKQNVETQATAQVVRLKQTYGHDPAFSHHMQEASKFLGTPAGMALSHSSPEKAIEVAYQLQLTNRMFDPQYQQQLGQAFAVQQQQNYAQRYQAGSPPAVAQHQMPMQAWGPQQQQPQNGRPSDQDVLNKVLSMGNNLGFPNVRMVSQPVVNV